MSKKVEYKTSEHVVAYMDILGAKELMSSEKDSLQIIHDVYEKALSKAKHRASEKNITVAEKIGTKIFSDNIVVYFPMAHEFDIMSIAYTIAFVHAFQGEMSAHNILIRGGITMGEFFCDDIMLWGNSLLRAYKIENEIAIYPRVVVDSIIVEYINKFPIPTKSCDFILTTFFKQDADGLYYINYLWGIEPSKVQNVYSYCEKTIKKNPHDLKLAQKLLWVERYIANGLAEVSKSKIQK